LEGILKILISSDMEGISGVVDWAQVSSKESEYGRFTHIMTAEVNAAIRGAFEGGAGEVAVTDGHDTGRNILIEELDPRASLHCGNPSSLSMVHGVEESVDAVVLVGYHARSGTPSAVLSHTYTGTSVADVWLNDRLVGELGLAAAVCGYYGTPVIFLSGDQAVCREAADWIPNIETVAVKKGAGRFAAECFPPNVTHPLIQSGVKKAVERFAAGQGPQPLKTTTPVRITIRFANPVYAEKALILPHISAMQDGRTVSIEVDDIIAAFNLFIAATSLS
jgi:D-amino peptidase